MDVRKDDLKRAAERGLVPRENVDRLWDFLAAGRQSAIPRFDFTHVAYYFGALVVIIAMTWYLRLVWDRTEGWAIILVALVYAGIFGGAGAWLRSRKSEQTLGGLLITVAVCMTPLLVFGIQRQLGLWTETLAGTPPLELRYLVPQYPPDQFIYNDLVMQVLTALCALIVLRFVRFSFLLVPALVALAMFATEPHMLSWLGEERWDPFWAAGIYGFIVAVIGLASDHRGHSGYAFWFHLAGAVLMCGALVSAEHPGEGEWLLVALANLVIVWVGVLIRRRAYTICGAIGIFIYFMHLSETLFRDSLWYPFVLTAFGITVILVGLWYRKKQVAVDRALRSALPGFVRKLLPPE